MNDDLPIITSLRQYRTWNCEDSCATLAYATVATTRVVVGAKNGQVTEVPRLIRVHVKASLNCISLPNKSCYHSSTLLHSNCSKLRDTTLTSIDDSQRSEWLSLQGKAIPSSSGSVFALCITLHNATQVLVASDVQNVFKDRLYTREIMLTFSPSLATSAKSSSPSSFLPSVSFSKEGAMPISSSTSS